MTLDLTGPVYGDANSSSSCPLGSLLGNGYFWLCVVSSSIFVIRSVPSRNSNGININNSSLTFLSTLLDIPTNCSGDLGKNALPFPQTSPVQLYHGLSSLESEVTLTYFLSAPLCYIYFLKGSIRRSFETQFRKIFFNSPNYLSSLYLKKYFSVAVDWANLFFLIFGFWDPLSSSIPISQTNMLDTKPDQLPSTLYFA